ncbi:MAG: OmpH family outer membrane protein [Silicimonas sp.]|nr:OmpH family outer membrane protein [Silicimonas sp.]
MSRFRPSSRGLRAALAALALALAPTPGLSQSPTPVLTIDQDRLFSETRLGAEALRALEAEAQDLAAENQQIENNLIAEELDLTEQRPTLPAEEFRALATAFDARVQQLRAEQDEKARRLNRLRDEAQSKFLRDSADIISDIVRARGAVLVLDRRDVFLSADSIDITNEAIARINAAEPED